MARLGLLVAIVLLCSSCSSNSAGPSTNDEAANSQAAADAGACEENLYKLEGAEIQWALENKLPDTARAKWEDIVGEGSYIREMPVCPAGGSYTLHANGMAPACSIPSHTFVPQRE